MITITEEIGEGRRVTVDDAGEIPAAILPWFPFARHEIRSAIAELAKAAARHEYTGYYEAYLAVRLERS